MGNLKYIQNRGYILVGLDIHTWRCQISTKLTWHLEVMQSQFSHPYELAYRQREQRNERMEARSQVTV